MFNKNKFFAILNIAIKKKVRKFIVPLFKDSQIILLNLYNAGYIAGYTRCLNDRYIVHLRFDPCGHAVINSISVLSTATKIKYLHQQDIRRLLKLHRTG